MQRIVLYINDARERVCAGLLGGTDSEKLTKIMLYLSDTEAYAKVKGNGITVDKPDDVEKNTPQVIIETSKKSELYSLRQNQIVLFVLLLISIIVNILK